MEGKNPSPSGSLIVNDTDSKEEIKQSAPRMFNLLTIIFGIIAIAFIALSVVCFLAYNSASNDVNSISNEKDKLSQENSGLKSELEKTKKNYDILYERSQELERNVTNLTSQVKTMNNTIISQNSQISSLQTRNLIYLISGGVSLAGGAGAGAYAFYEVSQVNKIKTDLDVMTERRNHYENYFNLSKLWLIEDYLLYYRYGYIGWTGLYEMNDGWNRDALVNKINGKENTTTIIVTDKGWVISASLRVAWNSDGNYIRDPDVFTMAVNRVLDAWVPPNMPENANYAARLPLDAMIEFGKGEILIFNNVTGRAIGETTFTNSNWEIPETTFYAGEPYFKVASMSVFETDWTPKSIIEQKIRGMRRL